MLRLLTLLTFGLISFAAFAEPPTSPSRAEIELLIKNLGSMEFAEREDASKRLEKLGVPVLEDLRTAIRSEDPEVVRRAAEIVRRIERTVANDKALSPTLVAIEVRNQPLDAVLAEVSKQSKYEVVLGGLNPEELATRKVTISTGETPFWSAVLAICDAAKLQVGVVGGFIAPGSMPYLGRAKGGVRISRNSIQAVVLEARDAGAPLRSSAVRGAVLVEALPIPRQYARSEAGSVLLQAWPEPRLQWQNTVNAVATRAIDSRGEHLKADYHAAEPRETVARRDGVVFIRNADGSVSAVPDDGAGAAPNGRFAANSVQALLRFKPSSKPIEMVQELEVSLFAVVRSGLEPLSKAQGLTENQPAKGVGEADVELTAVYRKAANGKLSAEITVNHEAKHVIPACLNDEIPGLKGTNDLGFGNHTVYGVLVTDKNGRPFGLGLKGATKQIEASRRREAIAMTLELVPDRNQTEPPAVVAFWGTHAQHITIPVVLKDVPISGGK
jgi:hypothetical protein